jgi:hypothetical protein
LGRSPLAAVIDDTTDNDPYAAGTPRDAVIALTAPQVSASTNSTPLSADAVLAALGSQISAQTRAKIASESVPSLGAALVLGSPDFMRR